MVEWKERAPASDRVIDELRDVVGELDETVARWMREMDGKIAVVAAAVKVERDKLNVLLDGGDGRKEGGR